MERFLAKVQEWIDDYAECFAERPLAISIILLVSGFVFGRF